MPPRRANTRSAALSATQLAARTAVLEDSAPLMERVLAALVDASDLANAGRVCRLWARVVAHDPVWRAAWRILAGPALRSLEPLAQPAGVGFRAAAAQLRLCDAPPAQPWTLRDFQVAVDATWRGRPLFSSLAPLADFEVQLLTAEPGEDGEAVEDEYEECLLQLDNQEDGTVAEAFMAAAVYGEERFDKVDAQLRVRVLRADGAVASLLSTRACDSVADRHEATWSAPRALGDTMLDALFFHDGNEFRAVSLAVRLYASCYGGYALPRGLGLEVRGDKEVDPFSCCHIALGYESMEEDGFVTVALTPEQVLQAVTRSLRWVEPHAPLAAAQAAQRRAVAPALGV
jgi:hypothetical protein